MIAQKLKNGQIAIGNAERKDATETIYDLRVAEFYRLSKCTRNWSSAITDRRDIMYAYAPEDSKLLKEFDKIYNKRKLFEEKLMEKARQEEEINKAEKVDVPVKNSNVTSNTDVPKPIRITAENSVTTVKELNETTKPRPIWYESTVNGTSRLIRIPSAQTIKISRRKGISDNTNRPNSVCIDNAMREEFFKDVKASSYFNNLRFKVYELQNIQEDSEIYEKWNSIVTKVYEEGLNGIKV